MNTENTSVNVHDLKTNYSKYLEQVVISHQEIVLSRYGKPVAKLVPLTPKHLKPRVPGQLKGKLVMSPDFDEPMMELWDIE